MLSMCQIHIYYSHIDLYFLQFHNLRMIARNQFIFGVRIIKSVFERFSSGKPQPKETFDSYFEVEQKVERLAEIIALASYPIVFTGAGISTSSGIPDYRSGETTTIKTGPGMYNRKHDHPIAKLADVAHPSLSHMFIADLMRKGIIKHLVSQNTDGLHLKSGIQLESISELHGNRNLEYCISCNRKYLRSFRTLKIDGKRYSPGQKRGHITERQCENCGGQLHDNIIYFGEKLPSSQLAVAYQNAHKADLCICIGSSLTVLPSANVPLLTVKKQNPGKLVIINIQETPFDDMASLRIGYFCDDVFELLARKMKIQIPKLVIKHFLLIKKIRSNNQYSIIIEGKDHQNNNLSFIKEISLSINGQERQLMIQGHKSIALLTEEEMQNDIIVTISHHGDEKQFLLYLSSLKLDLNHDLIIKYEMEDGKQWQMSKYQVT